MARERKFTTEDLFQKTKKLLLELGYEGFTIRLLAKELGVTRAAIYKYYENKDELISDFMLYEMNQFMSDLKKLDEISDFENQFEFLLRAILKHDKIHQVLGMIFLIPKQGNERMAENKKKLNQMHVQMYERLQQLIEKGKKQRKIKSHLPDELIIGMIFQTISIPNSSPISDERWFASMKEMVAYGIFNHD
ncbi:TetR/AcrR family transcriptional regulator [Fervidibacillus halotolerans]|uniref:TetR/AcrR family transcriptional regulator n=1 Tax=Fervidibacillus halotolerans TaxID=2980027 RepID=A0A9E8LYF2_9BACI|nr:TetR/AcrR family transcriptional regulator [Fervidibacillus halotolerans]WAA12053.1 TetR/AcrR family transcriptional regulator [Fervidibacillus halotolerans]